ASVQGPSIYPLTSCCKTATRTTSVTVGCLVTGYFPEPVTVTWDTGSLKSSILTFPAVQHPSSSLYMVTSQVTVPGKLLEEKLTCSVAHAAANGSRSINFTDPSVKLFYSSCDPHGDTQATIQLRCYVSGYAPGKVTVSWLADGQEDENLFVRTEPDQLEGELASTRSEVNVTQGQWVSRVTYTCRVTYYGFVYDSHSEPRGVSAYLSPPTPLELYVHKSPKITCLVVDLASSENVSLTWSRANKDSEAPLLPDPPSVRVQRMYNGTYTATSTLPVSASDWIEGETYYCNVTHPDLPKPILRSISKGQGKRLAPEVYVFRTPKKPESGSDLALTCLIQNFFPADISVRWLRNGALVPADRFATTRPRHAGSSVHSFFIYSRLVVSQADWEQSEFACQVIHEALPGPRTLQKSESKDPGK
uniref:Ig-like domain-containing protein n=1 Tax=Catagonus wagneri TaxID=51154 RepID=A0A8C3VWD4_9CETA